MLCTFAMKKVFKLSGLYHPYRIVMPNLSNMKIRFTILLIISFFISFGQTNRNIIGLYGECKPGYFACSQIEFKSDSTFEYGVFFDVGGLSCWSGKWEIEGNIITINSYSQPKTEDEIKFANQAYSFVYTDYISNLQFRLKKNKLYIYDFEKKKISKRYYLKKTSLDKKEFKVCNNKTGITAPMPNSL